MKRHDMEQYSDAWWRVRRGIPTASQFHRICTPAKGDYSNSATGYICELIAETRDPMYGVHDDYVTDAMRNGAIMEPEARRFYEFVRGVEVEQVGFCTTDDGKTGSSPDGLIGDDGCLEIKSPIHHTQVAYLLEGGLPDKYKPQVHGHLLVTGRPWCDFMSYATNLPHLLVRVERDDYTERLAECLTQFHAEYDEAKARVAEMVIAKAPEPEAGEVVLF